MKDIMTAPFMVEMIRTTTEMYRHGWDERNGGNVSLMLDGEEVKEYLDVNAVLRTVPIGFKAPELAGNVVMESVASRLGKKTIEVKNISKAYDGVSVVRDYSYIFLRDDRIGIVGKNGCGKSTLVKMITGEILTASGSVEIGDTVRIGYFMQENEPMDLSLRVIDYIRNIAEFIETS